MTEKEIMADELDRYFTMISEYESAKECAAKGNIDIAMMSAAKTVALYNTLKKTCAFDAFEDDDILYNSSISSEFVQAIAAEAYLSAAELELKEGNVINAQAFHWLIMPGTELRQHLAEKGLSKRAKRLDNLLCTINRKYFN